LGAFSFAAFPFPTASEFAMKKTAVLIFCLMASGARADLADLVSKMKDGLYETTVSMNITGIEQIPQGIQRAAQTTARCLTKEDIAKGSQILNPQSPRGPGKGDCQILNFNMSGDAATYTVSCPAQRINLDGSIAFTGNGYKGVNSGVMEQAGRPLKVTINFESKYVGACTK
jgi:hypothetical protein